MTHFAPTETKELSPRIPRGRGTSAAWEITLSWFALSDNIAHCDFGPLVASTPGRWLDTRRVSNLQWFEENEELLGAAYAGLWIAVLNRAVVASGSSFARVYEALAAGQINGALIVQVADNPNNQPRLIA